MDVFNSYVNGALQRALGERLARWGTEYIDPHNMKEPIDKQGRSLGVRVYEAYSCQFGFIRNSSTDIPRVGLTVDLRAKIVRTMVNYFSLCYLDSFLCNCNRTSYYIGYIIYSLLLTSYHIDFLPLSLFSFYSRACWITYLRATQDITIRPLVIRMKLVAIGLVK